MKQERVSISGSESDSSSESDSGRESGTSECDRPKINVQIKNKKENKFLEAFQNDNKLIQVKSQMKFNSSSIGPKDEIFLLQIPKSFDTSSLKGQVLFPCAKTKIIDEAGEYYFESENLPHESVMLLSTEKDGSCITRALKPAGMIRLKHPKKKYQTHVPFFDSEIFEIPLPSNLKNKHPILGADYKNEMKIDESIQNKLHDSVASTKKKLKKEPKHINLEEEYPQKDEDELIFKMLDESSTRKEKKTKKEKSNTADILFNKLKEDMNASSRYIKKEVFVEEETESVDSKKKRKRKHSQSQDESTITEESDIRQKVKKQKTKHSHIEQIEFDPTIVKKELSVFEILANSDDNIRQEKPPKKHKKIKQENLSDTFTSLLEESQIDKMDDTLNEMQQQKKHKYKNRIINSTMMSPNVDFATFDTELSQINVDASVKKKKKVKVKQELDSPDQIMEHIKSVLNTSSHKKQKGDESMFEVKVKTENIKKRRKSFVE